MALHSAAAIGALALPVGATVAAVSVDHDPGLAVIEAGYAKWQDMLSRHEASERLEEEYRSRAWDRAP